MRHNEKSENIARGRRLLVVAFQTSLPTFIVINKENSVLHWIAELADVRGIGRRWRWVRIHRRVLRRDDQACDNAYADGSDPRAQADFNHPRQRPSHQEATNL